MADEVLISSESPESVALPVDDGLAERPAVETDEEDADFGALIDGLTGPHRRRKLGIDVKPSGTLFTPAARRARCPACRALVDRITSWDCPRCHADLREIGFTIPQGWGRWARASMVAISRRLRRRPRLGPACGKCEYSTRGLGGFHCPECGSDLREVGVIDRDQVDPRFAAFLAAALWTCLFAAGAFAAFDWASLWLVPQSMSRRETIVLDGAIDGQPVHVLIRGVGKAEQWRFAGQAPLTLAEVVIFDRSRGSDLFAELRVAFPGEKFGYIAGSRYHYQASWQPGRNGQGISRELMLEIMGRVGLKPESEAVQAAADELLRVVRVFQVESVEAGTIAGLTGTTKTTLSSEPSGLNGRLVFVYFVGAWFVGTALFAWGTRRRFRVKGALRNPGAVAM